MIIIIIIFVTFSTRGQNQTSNPEDLTWIPQGDMGMASTLPACVWEVLGPGLGLNLSWGSKGPTCGEVSQAGHPACHSHGKMKV